ncbi:retron St85 family RNA-directed DNA polymerase [Brevundimonas sp.]|uniref:retron St85 family RNA-directed DNA polymerase n=1 Tax=Brevundimonas sp. TaxID=1871086 RepID=UPI00289E0E1E|nr:retron St85 family RNA-directed DNA polymerase [Brevundimonas sp.]
MSQLVDLLSQYSGLSSYDVRKISEGAPDRYKEYPIDKKSKNTEEKRIIAQPASEVKYLQGVLRDVMLEGLPIHRCATAYRKGVRLVDNAIPHSGTSKILKMDFRNFFNSITSSDWRRYCEDSEILSSEDIHLTSRLLFWRKSGGRALRLSVGAPTSPILSNILMYQFDCAISDLLAEEKVSYTRYADDLTFSAPRTGYMVDVKGYVRRAIKEIKYPSQLRINKEKTSYYTNKYRRSVTGLVLANDGRVTVGRDRKRRVFVGLYKFSRGELDQSSAMQIAGLLSFIISVERDFLDVVYRRYGVDVVRDLQTVPWTKKQSSEGNWL